ncbi:formate dehydrogenase subunit gamma [uncultured Paracoccus sp.]|uniref:formate dehydrogenase subunit gamma n=1 Tax=uncultured Paracoccus sp. TaxID=189685 RepID=UPI002612430D|nr:formate dehydrogenase subunit gamma [uncultured Paracoccus sp.]
MLDRAQAPSTEEIREVVTPLAGLEGPLLPMLHALQDTYGLIPEGAVPVLADLLNLGRAEVHGVISFYHDFRDHPTGRHVLKICRAEACQSMGGNALAAATLKKLGVDWHGTTADGAVTVEPIYCLGLCACAPAAMLDGRVVGRLDEDRMGKLLAEVRA